MFADQPADEDHLGLARHFRGISQFIRTCDTPMTIAIQGSWGTGKTSALKIIKRDLEDSDPDGRGCVIKCAWFDTWQYAVMGADDALVPLLINEFASIADKNNRNADFFKKASSVLFGTVELVLETLAERSLGGPAADVVKREMQGAGQPLDLRRAKDELQKGINELVHITDRKAAPNDPRRFVIFVDDLDRLEPIRALKFLEGIKNFIDCEHCVFVLAVDDRVIREGIAEKYNISDDAGAKEYTKHFFDKIIQVPFRVRMDQYDLKTYIRESGFLGDNDIPSDMLDDYVRAINSFDARNPRTIKRAFNLMALYEGIEANKSCGDQDRFYLFVILLLHMEFPDTFSDFVDTARRSAVDVVTLLTEGNETQIAGLTCVRFALDSKYVGDAWDFEDNRARIDGFSQAVVGFASMGDSTDTRTPSGLHSNPEEELTECLSNLKLTPKSVQLSDNKKNYYRSQVKYYAAGCTEHGLLVSKTNSGSINLWVRNTMTPALQEKHYVRGKSGESNYTFVAVQSLEDEEFRFVLDHIRDLFAT